jgi:hypothetical protein
MVGELVAGVEPVIVALQHQQSLLLDYFDIFICTADRSEAEEQTHAYEQYPYQHQAWLFEKIFSVS